VPDRWTDKFEKRDDEIWLDWIGVYWMDRAMNCGTRERVYVRAYVTLLLTLRTRAEELYASRRRLEWAADARAHAAR
jgi:hypothetical protein